MEPNDQDLMSADDNEEMINEEMLYIENNDEMHSNENSQNSSDDPISLKTITEFSVGTLWNWFMPNCFDIWSSSASINNPQNQEIVLAYGVKSFLFLADVFQVQNKKKKNREWNIRYRDIVNVFGLKPKSEFFDTFRSNTTYISTVVFDKTFSVIKHGSSSANQRTNMATSCAMLFLGNIEGIAALYDCHRKITLLQNLPFSSISKSCCRKVTKKKILSAAWLHYQTEGPVVYYSLDTHLIVWKVKKNKVKIFHDNKQDCSASRINAANLQIACLASLPAECLMDKSEHKLAIGYMGGKVIILGLDPMTGHQTSLTIFSENGHNDDICSLAFSSSHSSNSAYHQGLLCSISRDSVLKVWSCSNQNEIAEHRILGNASHNNRENRSNRLSDWFTGIFLPRSKMSSPNAAYEIVLTNSSGDLLTFTLPEKGMNSKLRIGKTQSFQPSLKNNELINHSSVIFSLALNLEHQIILSISLDYKMILWDLQNRMSNHCFHTFSCGALGIDLCLSDKRASIASGNNIFVFDFTSNQLTCPDETNQTYNVHVQRLVLSLKHSKFYNVIWNRKYYERLGRLLIGTSSGELYHYDLNSKSILFKIKFKNKSKIYSIVWLDSLFLHQNSEVSDDGEMVKKNQPVVLTLHQNGNIMVNPLNNESSDINDSEKDFEQFLMVLPEMNQKVKRTAMITSMDVGQSYLFLGNDDGTVDVFRRVSSDEKTKFPEKSFCQMYRFRAFNHPCLSMDFCTHTNWLAVTALHENSVNCYHLDLNEQQTAVVKTISTKCQLLAHEERVSSICWSPFNTADNQEKILLASASYDTSCIIWNVATKLALKCFLGHNSIIYTIKWCHFNPDFIFSGGEDNFFFWNWTIQSDFESKQNFKLLIQNKNKIRIISLCRMLQPKNDEESNSIDNTSSDNQQPANDQNSLEKTLDSLSSEVNSLTSNASNNNSSSLSSSKSTKTIKALFPLSNQIEHNSSKSDILNDIKLLFRLKTEQNIENNQENLFDRILLYGSWHHIERFLQLEIDNHKKNKNIEGQYILSLFLDARGFIEKSIQQNECDPILTLLASGFSSKKLFQDSMNSLLGPISTSTTVKQPSFQPKVQWNNHHRELSALMRLCCMNDFQGAIDSLLAHNLFREAVILSVKNLASPTFVKDLMHKWYEFRIKQGNYERAIKCLVAAEEYDQVVKLLEQRRTLCSDTSNPLILKQYDEIIEMMKSK